MNEERESGRMYIERTNKRNERNEIKISFKKLI